MWMPQPIATAKVFVGVVPVKRCDKTATKKPRRMGEAFLGWELWMLAIYACF